MTKAPTLPTAAEYDKLAASEGIATAVIGRVVMYLIRQDTEPTRDRILEVLARELNGEALVPGVGVMLAKGALAFMAFWPGSEIHP